MFHELVSCFIHPSLVYYSWLQTVIYLFFSEWEGLGIVSYSQMLHHTSPYQSHPVRAGLKVGHPRPLPHQWNWVRVLSIWQCPTPLDQSTVNHCLISIQIKIWSYDIRNLNCRLLFWSVGEMKSQLFTLLAFLKKYIYVNLFLIEFHMPPPCATSIKRSQNLHMVQIALKFSRRN